MESRGGSRRQLEADVVKESWASFLSREGPPGLVGVPLEASRRKRREGGGVEAWRPRSEAEYWGALVERMCAAP